MAAERSTASARAIAARQTYDRERRLFAEGISPRQDLEAAHAARAEAEAELSRTTAAAAASRVSGDGRSVAVVSPIAGRVTAAPAVLGAYVTAGAELFRVADPGRVELRAAAPAADAARIAVGDRASVETSAGRAPAGVRSITPSVDAETRAAAVVLALTGDAQGLKPGQAVRVRLTPHAGAAATARFAVPEEAVQSVDGRDVVFVRTAGGFQATPVTVGARSAGRAEVVAGLAPGQTVAGRGAFLLKAELGKGEAEHGH
jgi:cobalt-zinc-cadmium efflux system membrane fusion protein